MSKPTLDAGALEAGVRAVVTLPGSRGSYNSRTLAETAILAYLSAAKPTPTQEAGHPADVREWRTLARVVGAYLHEKGEAFRMGEGAKLLDAYEAVLAAPDALDAGRVSEIRTQFSDYPRRAEIIRLMREEFDPHPNWELPAGQWDDNAEDVADRIIEIFKEATR